MMEQDVFFFFFFAGPQSNEFFIRRRFRFMFSYLSILISSTERLKSIFMHIGYDENQFYVVRLKDQGAIMKRRLLKKASNYAEDGMNGFLCIFFL